MATTRKRASGRAATECSPLRTGRHVFIRYPVESDRAEFIALRRASRDYLERWEPRPARGFDPWGNDAFDRELKLADTDSSQRYLICRKHDGAILGRISLGGIIRGDFHSCFIGYWIGSPHAGRGSMTEALDLTLRHLFLTLKLHRAEANIQPHNAPSRRVAEKCGLRLEGVSPKYLRIAGKWADHERWAITIEEWRRGRARRSPPRKRGVRLRPRGGF